MPGKRFWGILGMLFWGTALGLYAGAPPGFSPPRPSYVGAPFYRPAPQPASNEGHPHAGQQDRMTRSATTPRSVPCTTAYPTVATCSSAVPVAGAPRPQPHQKEVGFPWWISLNRRQDPQLKVYRRVLSPPAPVLEITRTIWTLPLVL